MKCRSSNRYRGTRRIVHEYCVYTERPAGTHVNRAFENESAARPLRDRADVGVSVRRAPYNTGFSRVTHGGSVDTVANVRISLRIILEGFFFFCTTSNSYARDIQAVKYEKKRVQLRAGRSRRFRVRFCRQSCRRSNTRYIYDEQIPFAERPTFEARAPSEHARRNCNRDLTGVPRGPHCVTQDTHSSCRMRSGRVVAGSDRGP